MNIKPKSVISNLSPGRTFDIVRCIKDMLGAFFEKTSIGVWSQVEHALHINILELRAAKFVILSFCRYQKYIAVHVLMDN